MDQALRSVRPALRDAAARLSAYAAFAISFAFAVAIVFGLVG